MRTNVPFLVLDLGFDVIDSVGRLHLEGDSLSGEGLDKDLHATQQGIESRLLNPPGGRNAEDVHWLDSR